MTDAAKVRELVATIERGLSFECDGCTYNRDGSLDVIGQGCTLHGEGYLARMALRDLETLALRLGCAKHGQADCDDCFVEACCDG